MMVTTRSLLVWSVAAALLLLATSTSTSAFAPPHQHTEFRSAAAAPPTTDELRMSSRSTSSTSSSSADANAKTSFSMAAEEYEALLQRRSPAPSLSHKLPQLLDTSSGSSSTSSIQNSAVGPVLSAALLITGNTVGAGCLVLPELARGPGLAAVTGLFGAAYVLNLVSGLVLAEVAIRQKESSSDTDNDDLPATFKEFAATNLQSPAAGTAVSVLSLFVNACVLAFDLSRVGAVGPALLPGVSATTVASVWAAGVAALLVTQPAARLSGLCGLCVAALFGSFGSLLLPGLAALEDPLAVFWAPGSAPECTACLAHLAPIVLMSMVYQNIVPTVTKLLDYDRHKTASAIALGSAIPLGMYVAWCLAGVGGGVDLSVATAGPLLTVFSVATLGGSSMGSSMSLTEELSTYFGGSADKENSNNSETNNSQLLPDDATTTAAAATVAVEQEQEDSTANNSNNNGPFAALPVLSALSLPLAAAVVFGQEDGGAGLTSALSLAGSFGSPLLYGVIPALMAHRQRQRLPPHAENLVPAYSLPLLGGLATTFVGQEVVTRASEWLAFAT